MNIIFLMSKPDNIEVQQLLSQLQKLNYSCIDSFKSGEIDQLGIQMGRVAMIFFDPGEADKFLQNKTLSTFETFSVLFASKTPMLTPEISEKLKSINLNLYSPDTKQKLIQDLADFFSGKIQDADTEIQFSIHQDLKKTKD